MHDDNRTGNDGTALKDSIPYWDILLCKFQGKDNDTTIIPIKEVTSH